MNGAGRPMAQGRSCRLALALRFSLAAAMLLGITAAIFAARSGSAMANVAADAPRLLAPAAPVAQDQITDQIVRFAMNALLVPLLDDHEPPQWTDVALQHFCGPGTRVEINGHPLVPGTAIPAGAFVVRWHIDQCWPLDYAAFELSGSVELLVFHEDTGLSAIVSAQRLRIATTKGSGHLGAPFAAMMALGGAGSLQAP